MGLTGISISDVLPPLAAAAGLGAWLWAQFLALRRDFSDGLRRIHDRVDALDRAVARIEGARTIEREACELRAREMIAEGLEEHQAKCPRLSVPDCSSQR